MNSDLGVTFLFIISCLPLLFFAIYYLNKKRHIHNWIEIARTFAESRVKSTTYYDTTDSIMKKSAGMTTILFKCSDPKCNKTFKEEMAGKIVEAPSVKKG